MSERFHQRLKAYSDELDNGAKAVGEYVPENAKVYAVMKAILFREVDFLLDEVISCDDLTDDEFDLLTRNLVVSYLRAMNDYADLLESIS